MDSEPRLQRRTWGSAVLRTLVLLIAFACMVGFAVALAKVTLEPSAASVDLTHTNLTPGDSIRTYVDQPAFRDTVKQIGGNVLLGVPFGVLLPMLIPKARGLLRVVLVTAVVMLLVETAQGLLITGRAFDIDDVILNTTGALLGYLLLGRRLGRALHPRRTHWWQRTARAERSAARAERAEQGSPVKKSPVKKAPAKKSPAKKAPAKRSPAKKSLAKKSPAKKSQARKPQPKKPAARKSPAPKAAAAVSRWWSGVRTGRRSVPRRP
ncbi:VanZ family protein [Streptomyces sp. NBC_00144]|uniref:VanZ family protein n=1 Tax=unclassified Streptomyces TaxID=2593676 RepID=UPI00324515C6|nr:VanZ family protein [Streptomyces sp. NBC_00932]